MEWGFQRNGLQRPLGSVTTITKEICMSRHHAMPPVPRNKSGRTRRGPVEASIADRRRHLRIRGNADTVRLHDASRHS
jgi:hypothetical protein